MAVECSSTLTKVACFLLIFLVVVVHSGTVHRIERNVPSGDHANNLTTTKAPKVNCTKSTPCGWAVYTPYYRRVDYFMRNSYCQCPPKSDCMRTEDDLTISAYVYHCLPNKPPTTTTTTTPEPMLMPST